MRKEQASSQLSPEEEGEDGVGAILGLYLVMLEQRRLGKETTWIETPRAHN